MGTVAITGAASGIGAATTARLQTDGHRVITVDLRDADVTADLGTAEGRTAAIEGVTDLSGGRLDGLVTCAGLAGLPNRAGSLLASVNYFGSVVLLDGLRPALVNGDRAAAVAISSNSTTVQPNWSPELVERFLAGDEPGARELADQVGSIDTYPATKVAIARYVRRNAVTPNWIGEDITLNAIAPGKIATPLVAEGMADPDVRPLLEQFPIPVGRDGKPEEIAALIAFLLGPDARFFCGSVIWDDGGSDALLRPDDWPAVWKV